MKKTLRVLALALGGATAAVAAPVPVVGVLATANGKPFGSDPAAIAGGVIPAEGGVWNGEGPIAWSGKGNGITLTFDQVYALQDLVLHAHDSDSFSVQLVLNGGAWSDVFRLPATEGQAPQEKGKNGRDVDGNGGPDDEFDARWLSFAGGDAQPVFAVGLLIKGDNDNKNGSYVIDKLSLRGTPVSATSASGLPAEGQGGSVGVSVNPVPEPGTVALLSIGLFGAGLALRRRRPR